MLSDAHALLQAKCHLQYSCIYLGQAIFWLIHFFRDILCVLRDYHFCHVQIEQLHLFFLRRQSFSFIICIQLLRKRVYHFLQRLNFLTFSSTFWIHFCNQRNRFLKFMSNSLLNEFCAVLNQNVLCSFTKYHENCPPYCNF